MAARYRRASAQARHRGVGKVRLEAAALGPVCDGSAALDACLANAEQIRAAYTDCDETPPSLAELCPDFLATSCDACPEYFECLAEVTSCTAEGFSTELGCSCPG